MALESSNPAWRIRGGTPSAADLQAIWDTPDKLTLDDVFVHTIGMFALLGVMAAIGWAMTGGSNAGLAMSAGLVALGLSFWVSFSRRIRAGAVVAFTAFEGVFVGGVSRVYESQFHGIVVQALAGTGVIFVGMLLAYRSGKLRATPRMARIVVGTLLGVVGVSLIDLVLRLTGLGHVPAINSPTPLGILITLAILVVASLQFILDFDYIERAIRSGAPRQEAWRAAYGLVVGFVWVYFQLLRLLAQLQRR